MPNDSHIERLAGRLRAAGIRSDDAFERAYGRSPGKRERRALAMATHSKSAPNSMVQSHARRSARFHANTVFKTARPDLPRVPLNMAEARADERRAGVSNELDSYSYHRDWGLTPSREGLRHARVDVARGQMIVGSYRKVRADE